MKHENISGEEEIKGGFDENSVKETSSHILTEAIKFSSDKDNISDGVLTLGTLHKDRLVLFLNLVKVLTIIYEAPKEEGAKEVEESKPLLTLWHKHDLSYPKGFLYMGIKIESSESSEIQLMGGLFPVKFLEDFMELGSVEDNSIDTSVLPEIYEAFGKLTK